MQTRFTLRCIQSGEKCSFISLLAPYPFNKYKFLIKILSSLVKVILFIYITVVCQGAWLPWKPCSWYSIRTKLFELNQSVTEWRCLVWKIVMGELILMTLYRPALGVHFLRHSLNIKYYWHASLLGTGCQKQGKQLRRRMLTWHSDMLPMWHVLMGLDWISELITELWLVWHFAHNTLLSPRFVHTCLADKMGVEANCHGDKRN